MKKVMFALALFTFVFVGVNKASAGPFVTYCPGGPTQAPAAVTFGGSGIPNNAVCQATLLGMDLALTATARLDNPTVTNNGIDTFNAGAGSDTAHGQPNYAIWNFDFYGHNTTNHDLTFQVLWDTNPGANTDISEFGHFDVTVAAGATFMDSWNEGFGFIDTGIATANYSPAQMLFNQLANGQYGFAANVIDSAGLREGIGANVNVTGGNDVSSTPVPEPATLVLLGSGLLFVGRRRLWSRKGMTPAMA